MEEKEKQDKAPAGAVERRFFKTETRASKGDDDKMVIGGTGVVFDQYTNMGWYAEVVKPGFFEGIKDDRCACLFNHDESQVLGRKKNETLVLKTVDAGLDYQATLPSHRADVYELIDKGYIYESSFAFTALQSNWSEVDRSLLVGMLPESDLDQLAVHGKIAVRELVKGKELFDVSPVTYGAYEGTSTDTRIARRSFDMWKASIEEDEDQETDEKPLKSQRARLLEAIVRSHKI